MASLVTRKLNFTIPWRTFTRLQGHLAQKGNRLCQELGRIPSRSSLLPTRNLATSLQEKRLTDDEQETKIVKQKQQEILNKRLEKLDSDLRNTGRVLVFELEKVMRIIELSGVCTSNQALLVLKFSGKALVDMKREDRSQLLDKNLQILADVGVAMDASHYNAILRVHLENQTAVPVPEFLARMEEAGVKPNRVTYQHLIGIYCLEGNIGGAMTILEHMKAEDMPVNETVLISILGGHCFQKNSNAVKDTLEIMKSMGLSEGVESTTSMACGYAMSGDWSKVEEVLAEAEENDLRLGDGDIFSIISACSQGGLIQECQTLMTKFPKKRGYFHELRNYLPQIAFSGNVKTAVEIYLSLNDNEQTQKEQLGLFLVNAVVNSGATEKEIFDGVKRMEEAGYSSAVQFMVQGAAQSYDKEKFQRLIDLLKADKDGTVPKLNSDLIFKSLRSSLQSSKSVEKPIAALNNLHSIGVDVPIAFIHADLLPSMLKLDKELPVEAATRLRDSCPFLSWPIICSSMLTCLYNNERAIEMTAATGFLLNVRSGYLYPERWNASLARAYLKTLSIDDLITSLFVASRKSALGNSPEKAASLLFRAVDHILTLAPKFQPKLNSETIVESVVTELNKSHIGIPSDVADALKKRVKSSTTLSSLDEASSIWSNRTDYWTSDKEAEFVASRKKIHAEKLRSQAPPKEIDYTGYFKVPDSIEEMEQIQRILSSKGMVNGVLSGKLITAYVDEGRMDKAMEVASYCQEKSEFCISPSNLEAIVADLVSKGNAEKAIEILTEQQKRENNKIFISTLMVALAGLAEKGKSQMVLDIIDSTDVNKFIISSRGSNAFRLLTVYSNKGDTKMVQEVFNHLSAKNLASVTNVRNLHPLIEVHLENDDINGALAEFERISRLFKKVPKKFLLTTRLIEDENVEGLQHLLDISIEILGEQASLYDLTFAFLHMDRRAQAKKLLETPGLRYEESRMEYICNQLRQAGNLSALEDLVILSKSIFGCDRDSMYKQLLKAYPDNSEKISDIWLQIQEEGHVPSDDLKIIIGKALKARGQDVPFEIPAKATSSSSGVKAKREDLIDDEVSKALETKDHNAAFEMVKASFDTDNTSLKCRRNVIEALIEEKMIQQAAELAALLANNFENPNKIRFRKLYYDIWDQLEESKLDSFLKSLNPKFREILVEKRQSKTDSLESK